MIVISLSEFTLQNELMIRSLFQYLKCGSSINLVLIL